VRLHFRDELIDRERPNLNHLRLLLVRVASH